MMVSSSRARQRARARCRLLPTTAILHRRNASDEQSSPSAPRPSPFPGDDVRALSGPPHARRPAVPPPQGLAVPPSPCPVSVPNAHQHPSLPPLPPCAPCLSPNSTASPAGLTKPSPFPLFLSISFFRARRVSPESPTRLVRSQSPLTRLPPTSTLRPPPPHSAWRVSTRSSPGGRTTQRLAVLPPAGEPAFLSGECPPKRERARALAPRLLARHPLVSYAIAETRILTSRRLPPLPAPPTPRPQARQLAGCRCFVVGRALAVVVTGAPLSGWSAPVGRPCWDDRRRRAPDAAQAVRRRPGRWRWPVLPAGLAGPRWIASRRPSSRQDRLVCSASPGLSAMGRAGGRAGVARRSRSFVHTHTHPSAPPSFLVQPASQPASPPPFLLLVVR